MNQALLVIAKRPAAGQTKTRLTPPLSAEQAAQLYECFLQDMLETARQVPDVNRLIAYWPESEAAYFQELAPDFGLVLQTGHSLGERLDQVLTRCLQQGYTRVVITNSDSPTLPADYLTQAFVALEEADVVLGPTDDGGYYLIGLKAPQPRLLLDVQMSTPTVLQDTLAIAKQNDVSVRLLPPWYDVDVYSEFERLQTEIQSNEADAPRHTRQFLRHFKLSDFNRPAT